MLEPPVYSWAVRNPDDNFGFQLASEVCVCVCVCVCVVGGGTDSLVGLNPCPVESDAISGQIVSELIKQWDTHLVS